ncbi:agamous-like MADS-box protein AGL36 [Salvia splendens]|uniref:agamous-like MADS-box protein AGL36 n=1 Tax=Salvia splendens TaxID=180675 RepID=UPI001C27FB4D|nr:agamous-like MADS-box protein AGL36 [Salvia splendens]
MVNQESYTRQRIKKATEQLRRLQNENSCRELEAFMFRCITGQASIHNLQITDVSEMSWVISQILREIKGRMDAMAAEHQLNQAAPPLPPPPAVEEATPRMEEDGNGMESFLWNLVQSPGGGSGMVLPYPYIFGQSSSSHSGQNQNPNPVNQ